jgi:hypothetical protein
MEDDPMATLSDILSGKLRAAEHGHNTRLNIDYPQPGEKVQRGHYAVRISADGAQCQVSVDDDSWQDCRVADGYSWFDWTPEKAGSHRIAVRARAGSKWVKTERVCAVE